MRLTPATVTLRPAIDTGSPSGSSHSQKRLRSPPLTVLDGVEHGQTDRVADRLGRQQWQHRLGVDVDLVGEAPAHAISLAAPPRPVEGLSVGIRSRAQVGRPAFLDPAEPPD